MARNKRVDELQPGDRVQVPGRRSDMRVRETSPSGDDSTEVVTNHGRSIQPSDREVRVR